MKREETIRYSEAFKRQVIEEIEAGKFKGPSAAAKAYQIRGAETVKGWLRRQGRCDLLRKRITITTMAEEDELKALRQRVRQLERALADSHMKGALGEAYLEIACETLGEEVAGFKKKHVTKLSDERPKTQP